MTTNSNRYKYLDSAGEHLHLLDGRPLIGTSRVGSILAKPLSWYGAGKAVEVFGCPDPKVLTKIKNKKATVEEKSAHYRGLEGALAIIKQCDIDQYAALVDQAYRAHDVYKRSRAKTGTDLHAECEKFIRNEMAGMNTLTPPPEIFPLIEWAKDNVKRFLWSESHVFSETHWIGGISDAGYETNDGAFGILDFKSSKEPYLEHGLQMAGYNIQASENGLYDADGNLIYELEQPVSRLTVFPFGGDAPQPHTWENISELQDGFLNALALYKLLNKEEAI